MYAGWIRITGCAACVVCTAVCGVCGVCGMVCVWLGMLVGVWLDVVG